MVKRFSLAALFAGTLLVPGLAAAWHGVASGRIVQHDVTSAGNFPFRITLAGHPALCGNSNTWAYVDDTDGNYRTYVAALLAARMMEQTVTVYSTRDASGYCRIGYIHVN